jgi:cytochrome oxidase Cu insertion factor (SCO1/SenC/PrrC family)
VVAVASPPAAVATPFVPELQTGDALPVTALVDQRGRRFTLGGIAAGATIVTFFYTRCRDANECPLTSAKFARLQTILSGVPTRLVEITIDPEHDTAPALARYAATFEANPDRWRIATGAQGDITALERRMGVSVSRSTNGDFVHQDAVVVLDPNGRISDTISGATWSPDDALTIASVAEGRRTDAFERLRFAFTRGIAAACGGAAAARGISLATAGGVFAIALVAFTMLMRRMVGDL